MRGSPKQPALGDHARRSIPASAGEPSGSRSYTDRYWVYPRECGGAVRSTLPLHIKQGLSPRVRGSQWAVRFGGIFLGSIPASAGEPVNVRLMYLYAEVYPRECGGALLEVQLLFAITGLSPRVRGSRRCASRRLWAAGSIPASAGEPQMVIAFQAAVPVYPRECGGAGVAYCLRQI